MMCQYLGGGRLQLPQEGPFLAVEVQGIDGQELFALGQQGIRRQLFPLPPDTFPGGLRGSVRNSINVRMVSNTEMVNKQAHTCTPK